MMTRTLIGTPQAFTMISMILLLIAYESIPFLITIGDWVSIRVRTSIGWVQEWRSRIGHIVEDGMNWY
jgi:hypothetical protein